MSNYCLNTDENLSNNLVWKRYNGRSRGRLTYVYYYLFRTKVTIIKKENRPLYQFRKFKSHKRKKKLAALVSKFDTYTPYTERVYAIKLFIDGECFFVTANNETLYLPFKDARNLANFIVINGIDKSQCIRGENSYVGFPETIAA